MKSKSIPAFYFKLVLSLAIRHGKNLILESLKSSREKAEFKTLRKKRKHQLP